MISLGWLYYILCKAIISQIWYTNFFLLLCHNNVKTYSLLRHLILCINIVCYWCGLIIALDLIAPRLADSLHRLVVPYDFTYTAQNIKGNRCVFSSHTQEGWLNYFCWNFGLKKRSGRMLYTTASKHLQTLWNWPYVDSVEKSSLFP